MTSPFLSAAPRAENKQALETSKYYAEFRLTSDLGLTYVGPRTTFALLPSTEGEQQMRRATDMVADLRRPPTGRCPGALPGFSLSSARKAASAPAFAMSWWTLAPGSGREGPWVRARSQEGALSAETRSRDQVVVHLRSKIGSAAQQQNSPRKFTLQFRRVDWSGRQDLNLRPPGPEPGALPG